MNSVAGATKTVTKRPRILLYNPRTNFYTLPLALIALASNLDRERYEVVLIDARIDLDAHNHVLQMLDGCLCVAMSVLTGEPILDALALSRKVKEQRPDVPVVWGGWHASLFPSQTLSDSAIDVTVQGQGELTFAALIQRLEMGQSLHGLMGTSFKEADGVTVNPGRELVPLEELSPPNYETIDLETFFRLKGKRQLDYISSIGCPFRCAFCADPYVYQRKWHGESAERVAGALHALEERYRIEDVNFQDETFFVYKNRVTAMAQALIARGTTFTWAATLRADQGYRLGDDGWELCKQSGLRRVLIGVESGSREMVKRIAKDTTLDQVIHCAEQCVKYDLEAIFSIIVGFPGETDDQVRETLAFAKQLNDISPRFRTPVFYFKPYPGSQIAFDIGARMPQTLEEWGRFDFVDGPGNEWISDAMLQEVEHFKLAYPGDSLVRKKRYSSASRPAASHRQPSSHA